MLSYRVPPIEPPEEKDVSRNPSHRHKEESRTREDKRKHDRRRSRSRSRTRSRRSGRHERSSDKRNLPQVSVDDHDNTTVFPIVVGPSIKFLGYVDILALIFFGAWNINMTKSPYQSKHG